MNLIAKFAIPLLVVLLTSCGSSSEQTTQSEMLVNVATAVRSSAANQQEFTFISKPFRASELSFRVGGPIEHFDVYVGNHYNQGGLIAQIDPRDFHIRKERAEGIYNQAKAEYERVEILYQKNNISASAFEKVRADYTSAKTAYQTATNELNDTKLVAPFNGYVSEVFIEKFQDVKASQKIVTLVELDRLRIELYVTQQIAFNADSLSHINLRFDADPDNSYSARVVEISKSTTSNNLSYLLTAVLDNKSGKLLSGMSGKVLFDGLPGKKTTSSVNAPQAALCYRPSLGDYVWVVDPATEIVSRRSVKRGDLQPDGTVALLSGLEADEIVATSGLRFLSEGMQIKINK